MTSMVYLGQQEIGEEVRYDFHGLAQAHQKYLQARHWWRLYRPFPALN
jgi:hypothetical protein